MINIEDLKPILQDLLEDRDDSADYLERVTGVDDGDANLSQEDVDAAVSEAETRARADFDARFKKAFFDGAPATPMAQHAAEENTPIPPPTDAPDIDPEILMAAVLENEVTADNNSEKD